MNQSDQQNQTGQVTPDTPEQFFREIEIQFLIHELKDPIAIVETGLRTLLEKQEKFGSLSSKQQNTLKRTLRNTIKARSMLNNLLEIGRSESGCFICSHFKPARSVYQALKDSLEIMTGPLSEELGKFQAEKDAVELLSQNGISLEFSARVHNTEIFQDEIKFRQIAGNLFKNALHHRRKRVNITMDVADENLVMAVSDDGPGVEPEHQEMIFQRYAQVKECSIVPRKGHGLGLAGALILARCLGGDIMIDSREGQGATFCLTLPMKMEGE
ncbi:MAG: HAMP domain-containing histidine kinase [Deltaproteobacteria bacterium]|nr:HAMP domain-containing histidine kinase [Deltaproteobacteria bacterium]